MKYIMHGKDIDLTKSISKYAEEKLGKLSKYFKNPDEINVTVLIKKKGIEDAIEVTIPIKNAVLRAEVSNKDLYTAIDKIVSKLERQIEKNKSKISNKKYKIDEFKDFETIEDLQEGQIVKRKGIFSKPMNEEEAILQMELLDHDFYVFFNTETNNYSVVYKRLDSNYGILDIK